MTTARQPIDYVARALAAFEAGFKTQTAKKDALADLSSAYAGHRNAIQRLCLDAGGPDTRMTPEQSDLYYGLPYDLHHYRPKHTAQAVKVFPEAAAACAEIEALVALRTKINAAEVAPKAPSKAQREQSIRLSATGKVYADEFGKMKPELARDYVGHIEGLFKRLAAKYQLQMVALLGADYWRRKLPEGVEAADVETFQKKVRGYLTTASLKGGAPNLDRARLQKHADDYAEGQVQQFVVKLTQKLGDLTDVRISWADVHGFQCGITGKLRGHDVRVEQSRKFVVNQQGTAFHQWPALIYVDGKFTTEAAFKRLASGA